ncbi:energy transducer TonB family protein [Celeribacter baekdonensis]|uniref:Energy transducer TonB n=1 Tax=Celeribacter baekdonensis TaxID=875171 RepID=A0A2R4LYC7_9RHOB|nr:TonB family protein [Celeribacter baekdonensis]AVW89905.1 energy transducer TonB [Celeribacter baekdonensis]
MTRAAEVLLCVGLSLGAHVALMSIAPRMSGAEAQGDAGTQLVSMAASTAALETLVEQWDGFAPPESLTEIAPPATPTEALDLPQRANAFPMALDAPPMTMTNLSPLAPQSPDVVPPEGSEPPKPPAPPPPAAPKSTPAKPAPSQPVKRPNATQSEAQKAAGAGGQTARGTKGTSQGATADAGQRKHDLSAWGGGIRAAIERKKRYPSAARGAKGKVVLQISVARTGALRSVSVARSSGNALLDQAALAAVQSIGQFKPAPRSLTQNAYSFSLQINFAPR